MSFTLPQILTRSSQRPPLLRIFAFVILIVTYAFWSSSTPDEFGIPEAVIAACLLIFVGLRGTAIALGGFLLQRQLGISKWVFICFLGLLVLPLIWGLAVQQNSLIDVVRDVIPLLYFFLPLFFVPHMLKYPAFWKKMCIMSLCAISVAYSIRFFASTDASIEQIGREIIFGGDDSYYPMDPAVLFGSTFLLAYGLMKLFEKGYLYGITCLIFGSVAFASLVAIIVRAQIFLVLFSLILAVFFGAQRINSPRIFWIAVAAVFLGSFIVLSQFEIVGTIYTLVEAKSENAGVLNSRDMEAAAVMRNAFSSVGAMLLGEGWGGVVDAFSSGDFVRYTHNIVFYFLLKGGVVGLAIGLAYCALIASALFNHQVSYKSLTNRAASFGIFNVLFLNLFIEPGFKMFSLGLVLTLLWLLSLEGKEVTSVNRLEDHVLEKI